MAGNTRQEDLREAYQTHETKQLRFNNIFAELMGKIFSRIKTTRSIANVAWNLDKLPSLDGNLNSDLMLALKKCEELQKISVTSEKQPGDIKKALINNFKHIHHILAKNEKCQMVIQEHGKKFSFEAQKELEELFTELQKSIENPINEKTETKDGCTIESQQRLNYNLKQEVERLHSAQEEEIARLLEIKNELLTHLKNEKELSVRRNEVIQKTYAEKIIEIKLESDQKLDEIRRKTDEEFEAMSSATTKHLQQENSLRKRNRSLEISVNGLIEKFNCDTSKKQEEIERIKMEYQIKKEQLDELEDKFSKYVEQCTLIEAEKERLEEANLKEKAAKTIQMFWRLHLQRNTGKVFKKKGKKKKEKKKTKAKKTKSKTKN